MYPNKGGAAAERMSESMGFFQKVRAGLARFMYGRNGVDQLGLTVVWTCLILDLLSMLISGRFPLAGTILYWIAMAAWVYALFRIFSKNLYKRRSENAKFTGWLWKMKNARSGAKARHADKDHKYFTCKQCKTICRVPVGKGNIIITCPKCGAQIKAKT